MALPQKSERGGWKLSSPGGPRGVPRRPLKVPLKLMPAGGEPIMEPSWYGNVPLLTISVEYGVPTNAFGNGPTGLGFGTTKKLAVPLVIEPFWVTETCTVTVEATVFWKRVGETIPET